MRSVLWIRLLMAASGLMFIAALAGWTLTRNDSVFAAIRLERRLVLLQLRGNAIHLNAVDVVSAEDPHGLWVCRFDKPEPYSLYGPTPSWHDRDVVLGLIENSQVWVNRGPMAIAQVSAPRPATGVVTYWWAVLLLTSFLPSLWLTIYGYRRFLRSVRDARIANRLCAGCGYDVRATVDRCPECGLAVAPVAM